MNSISHLYEYKDNNTRCYYIDSDGDEVIVSDEEDFEVALDYAKAKGLDNFKIYKCKQLDDSDNEQEEGKDYKLGPKDSLKMVAETVSVGDGDDLDSSDGSDLDDIQEIEPDQSILSKPSIASEGDLDNQLKSNVHETISQDESMYAQQEEADYIKAKEQEHFQFLAESTTDENAKGEVVIDMDAPKPSIGEGQVKPQTESQIFNQYEIVQSNLGQSVMPQAHDYQPKGEELKEVRSSSSSEDNESLNKSDVVEEPEAIQEEHMNVPKLEGNAPELSHNSKQTNVILSREEQELLELNSSFDGSEDEKEPSHEEQKLAEPQAKVDEEPSSEVDQVEEEAKIAPVSENDANGEQEEFKDQPRLSVSMSCANAHVVNKPEHPINPNIFKKAIESLSFFFTNPDKRMKIAQVDNTNEERSQDFVITCKPGKAAKKRWRIVNNSSIKWPKNVTLKCQQDDAEVEMPIINYALAPGEAMDVSVNIKISEQSNENIVKVFVFRLNSKIYGDFGEPLIATVEVIPDLVPNPLDAASQEEKLKEILELQGKEFDLKSGDADPYASILYEFANDFVEEGLGSFEQCLEALVQCKANYNEAKESLMAQNEVVSVEDEDNA